MITQPQHEDDAGLNGRVAIVTGGGAAGDGIGNGRGAAILLARAGTKVLVVDRDVKLAERTVEMITAEGGTAAAHAGIGALLQRLRGRKVKRPASANASAKRSSSALRFANARSALGDAVPRAADGSRPAAAK